MSAVGVDTGLLEKIGAYDPKRSGVQAKGNNEMGEDAFLKLVLAQLEHQDPLKPMENGDFLAQLAQMKSVSGIDDLNSSFKEFTSDMRSNQALQASSLVGRWVTVPGDSATLWDEVGMMGAFELPYKSDSVLVSIKNQSGEVIKQIDLKDQKAGMNEFQWDGLDKNGNQLKAGSYGIEVMARIDGEYEAVNTYSISPVDSVTLNNKGRGLTLSVNGVGDVPLSDVAKIM